MKTRFLPLALLMAPLASAQTLWNVAPNPGPGVDFVDLQSAIDAATDGDTIVVRAGDYADAIVIDKALRIVGHTGSTPPMGEDVTVAGLSVRGLQAGKEVLVAGLELAGEEVALTLKNNLGSVWIEDCRGVGSQGVGQLASAGYHPTGYRGIEAENCAEVVVLRSRFGGGNGWSQFVFPTFNTGAGGDGGLFVDVDRLVVHGSDFYGGMGGSTLNDDDAWPGMPGGRGLVLRETDTFAMGCRMFGGDGGEGGEEWDLIFGVFHCGPGGDGGNGVRLVQSTLESASNQMMGGTGGFPFPGASCSQGESGLPLSIVTGALVDVPVAPFELELPATVNPGQVVNVAAEGPLGSFGWIWIGAGPDVVVAPLAGTGYGDQLVSLAGGQLIGVGALPSNTPLTVPSIPGLPATFHVQLVGFELSSASFVLGGAEASVVLPPGV